MKTQQLSSELALYLGLIRDKKFQELMGITSRTSRLWRQKGIFPFIKFEKQVFYRLQDIKEILEDHYYRNKPLKNRR